MTSTSIFLPLSGAYSVQWSYPPMYAVWLSCLGSSTQTALLNRVESKVFCIINSPPLTDCLISLSHRRNVPSLSIFYGFFQADCSSELANCIPPTLPQPRCTRISTSLIPILSIFLMQELTNIFIFSSLTLVNSGTLPLSIFPLAYDLNFFKRGVS